MHVYGAVSRIDNLQTFILGGQICLEIQHSLPLAKNLACTIFQFVNMLGTVDLALIDLARCPITAYGAHASTLFHLVFPYRWLWIPGHMVTNQRGCLWTVPNMSIREYGLHRGESPALNSPLLTRAEGCSQKVSF